MSKKPLRIDDLDAPPVIGQTYLVPMIYYPWNERYAWWPTIGPKHEDAKYLNFEPDHYHVDGRFITPAQWRAIRAEYSQGEWHERPDIVFAGRPLADRSIFEHPPIVWKPRKCFRLPIFTKYAELERNRHPSLWRAFDGLPCSKVNGRIICPHKGADLTTIAPDSDGNITCPLHGLRFTRTGAPVSSREFDHE